MLLTFLAALPFIGAFLVAVLARAGDGSSGRNLQAGAAALATGTALLLLLTQAGSVLAGSPVSSHVDWVPQLGLSFSFYLDPLGFLFAGLILGIGLLIIVYARYYLSADDPMARFLCFLMLFQGAMLGIVISGNILLLLIFWELTSLTSFLLIGFKEKKAQSRQGARMALVVTGTGGLALIGGMLLLGHIAGTYELPELLERGDVIRASAHYPLALLLILVGCFTKSAQFPFHFWLPHAMAAPTPVSAYLHSSTMVKAGVFLLARLWPVLSGTELWFVLVTSAGLITMLLGAAVALFRHDLKAILAYSTVSHLGLLTMLFGFGTSAAAAAAVFHIFNHALFKAALFMNAGIIDHETGSRDIRLMGGLARLMPISALVGSVAAAAMAGIPPLNGFLSKELMLEEAAHTSLFGLPWLVPTVALLAASLSVAYSVRYAIGIYRGQQRAEMPRSPHDPPVGMWGPSAFLAAGTVLVGLLPGLFAKPLIGPVAEAVAGQPVYFNPKLWHGLTPALSLSLAAFAIGAALFWRYPGALRLWDAVPLPDAKTLFDRMIAQVRGLARLVSDTIHNGSLQRQLAVMFLVAVLAGVTAFSSHGWTVGTREQIPAPPLAILAWVLLVGATWAVLRAQRRRFLTLVYISVIGLIVSLAFVYLSAPDLALTQISVEVVTILLLLLALNLLPKQSAPISPAWLHGRDGLIAVIGGLCAALGAFAVMTREAFDPISAYHWANSKSGGGGTNVVNVTLVDFRAFDTFGEIIVLGIAALAIFALLEPAVRGVAGRRLLEWVPDTPNSPERHPMMFAVASRLLLPLALLAGAYIFLRGHNLPGGGFIAGLVVAIALLMQYMASGFEWADRRRRLDQHGMIALGVLAAAFTGLGALAFGAPLFKSAFDYFTLPVVGTFELTTALLFDVGVAMTVIGAVMSALSELSHVSQRAEKAAANVDPMDVDPSRVITAAVETGVGR